MAKTTGWDEWGAEKPLEEHVRLPMVADSTVETAVEIDTGLAPGMELGWAMLGMDWCFRDVASPHYGQPLTTIAGDPVWHLQLCRGDVPATPVLLHGNNDDVIYDPYNYITLDSQVGFEIRDGWFRLRKMERTQQDSLYLMFGSDVDYTTVSDPALEIFAIIYYRLVSAPAIPGHEE